MLYGSTAKIKGMFNLKTFYNVLFSKLLITNQILIHKYILFQSKMCKCIII